MADEDLVEEDALQRLGHPGRNLLPLSARGEVAVGIDTCVERLRLPDIDHDSAAAQGVNPAAQESRDILEAVEVHRVLIHLQSCIMTLRAAEVNSPHLPSSAARPAGNTHNLSPALQIIAAREHNAKINFRIPRRSGRSAKVGFWGRGRPAALGGMIVAIARAVPGRQAAGAWLLRLLCVRLIARPLAALRGPDVPLPLP